MIYLAYIALPICFLAVARNIILRLVPPLDQSSGSAISFVVLQLPVILLLTRSYFAAFAELFDISKLRLLCATAGAVAESTIVTPLVLVPGAYLAVRFHRVWDLLL